MAGERKDKPNPQEPQSVVDEIRATRKAITDKERSREEARAALPALREQVYGFIREKVAPYSVPSRYLAYPKIRRGESIYLEEPGEKWDPDSLHIPGVALELSIPLEENEEPIQMTVYASSYPDIGEPSSGDNLLDLQIAADVLPLYVVSADRGIVVESKLHSWIDKHGKEHTSGETVFREFELEDIKNIRQLLELAEGANEIEVREPYLPTS